MRYTVSTEKTLRIRTFTHLVCPESPRSIRRGVKRREKGGEGLAVLLNEGIMRGGCKA